jgi:hypothetical protein
VAAALRRRWRLLAVVAVLVVVLLVVVAVGAVGWVFSSKLLDPDHELGPYGIGVERVEVRDLPAAAAPTGSRSSTTRRAPGRASTGSTIRTVMRSPVRSSPIRTTR